MRNKASGDDLLEDLWHGIILARLLMTDHGMSRAV
jgi:hypothetical protein